MRHITQKFEINILETNESPLNACGYAVKNNCPAIIVDQPAFIPPMQQHRMSTRGNYKCILAVDFPHGKGYGFANKFRNLSIETWNADGFEILLSQRNEVETMNEVQSIVTQLKTISPVSEIRFVIDAFSRPVEALIPMLKAIKSNPVQMLRLDHHVTLPERDLSDEKIDQVIDLIREYTPIPIKLSTNITRERMEKYKGKAVLFDVTYNQAATIVKEYVDSSMQV